MNGLKRTVLVVALMGASTSVYAQVLMRRPLPSIGGRSDIPSETPAPTPTPTPAPGATPTPTPPGQPGDARAFVTAATCSGGYTYVSCLDSTLVDGAVKTSTGTYENCRQQNRTADWTRLSSMLAATGVDVVAPDKIYARQGARCGPEAVDQTGSYMTYAEQCVEGSPVCMSVSYEVDGAGSPTITDIAETSEWDVTPDGASPCSQNYSSTPAMERLLKQAGLFQDHNACGQPDPDAPVPLYAARSSCVTKVKYAPGWPQSGGADISTQLLVSCYGLTGLDGDSPVASRVQEQRCSEQNPTPAQKAVLASLAPEYMDYQEMDRSCPVSGGVNLNLQIKSDPVARSFRLVSGERKYRTMATFETRERYVYVCTDLAKNAPGSYYGDEPYFQGGSYGKNSYPSTKGNCPLEKIQQIQRIQEGYAVNDFDRVNPPDPARVFKVTVEDAQDLSQLIVTTVETSRIGEDCAGPYSETCMPDTDGEEMLDLDGNGTPDADEWAQ